MEGKIMKNETGNSHVDFTRAGFSGEVADVARATAESIRAIVKGDKIEKLKEEENIFIILRSHAQWTLYPPKSFDDQNPDLWRLAVEALEGEHSNMPLDQQQARLERDLPYIEIVLIRYH